MRLLFFIIYIPFLSFAQELQIKAIKTWPSSTYDQFIGVDEYKNIYTVTGSVLYKSNAEKTIQFSDIQLGNITSVDILNPLRLTLFYEAFNTVIILDNTLNEITRINFNNLENFKNISHARTASDRRLWVYNIDLQKVELYNYRNDRVDSSFPPQEKNAVEMASNFNDCWILTQTHLIHYNQYGSLLNKEPAQDLSQIFQQDENIFGLRDGALYVKAKNSQVWTLLKDLPEGIKQFYLNNGILYIYTGELLSSYQLNLPKT